MTRATCSIVFALAFTFPFCQSAEAQITPVFECWRESSDGLLTAVFGYVNLGEAVTIEVGDENFVTPAPVSHGQPTVFASGTVNAAFTITLPVAEEGTVTWQVGASVAEVLYVPEMACTECLCPAGSAGVDGGVGPTGADGPAGDAGLQGVAGPAGVTGPTGTIGPRGATGEAGPAGAPGERGETGGIGRAGAPGPDGATGPDGAIGPDGPRGPEGAQGLAGAAGPDGAAGPAGLPGVAGIRGPAGAPGAVGPIGERGPEGPPGIAGSVGATGATGAVGAAGVTGTEGLPGPAGGRGPTGARGPDGDAGPTGDQGPLGPAGPRGLTGPPGNAGAPGGAGNDATRTFGLLGVSSLPLTGAAMTLEQPALVTVTGAITARATNGGTIVIDIGGIANDVRVGAGERWTTIPVVASSRVSPGERRIRIMPGDGVEIRASSLSYLATSSGPGRRRAVGR